MNTEKLELLLKEKLEIPYVNFEGLDEDIAKEITEGLFVIFDRYPALKKAICSIGNSTDIIIQTLMFESSFYHKLRHLMHKLELIKLYYEQEKMVIIPKQSDIYDEIISETAAEDSAMFVTFLNNRYSSKIIYYGIGYSEDLEKLKKHITTKKDINEDEEYPLYPNFNSAGIKGTVYHEIAHILFELLKFTEDKQKQFFHQFSQYESDTFEKTLLDHLDYSEEHRCHAFAEYICAPDICHPIIQKLGQYIDEQYELYKDSKRFNINWRYKKHLERAEKEEKNKELKLKR